MKNYLKLHRLAFRRRVAGAANREAAKELQHYEAYIRQLQKDFEAAKKAGHYLREQNSKDAMAKIETAIERAIAVRDIMGEERQRVEEAFNSAASSYQNVLGYLEQNRQLIPEGIPNGI